MLKLAVVGTTSLCLVADNPCLLKLQYLNRVRMRFIIPMPTC